MKNEELKCLLAKVAIIRSNRDNYEIFNTDELLNLKLKSDSDNSHFLEIGETIILENTEYKVTNISFRLDPIHIGIGMHSEVNLFNQEPEDANCQVAVFVDPL